MQKSLNPRNDALDAYILQNKPVLEMLRDLSAYQRAALLTKATHKSVLATRRAGKSHAACVALIRAALSRRNAVCYYLALTRQSAKRIAWKVLKELCRKYAVPAEFKESELVVEFENGGSISLYGVNQDGILDNLRGTPVDLAVLDEAASFRGGIVEELVEEVLEPAFADHDGQLMVIGTPGPVCSGYFYEATTGGKKEFISFRWDLRNNPHIAKGNPAAWVEEFRKRKGWSLDNPKFVREYCGEWTQSDELQVYKFTREKNVGQLPDFPLTHHVLGVDLGFKDAMAFVVIGYDPARSKSCWVVHSEAHTQMQLSSAAERIKELQARYRPHATVIDEGGLGKSIAEDWRTRLAIPCEPAKKTDKRGHMEQLNAELWEGRIIVPGAQKELIGELLNLTWKDETRASEDPTLDNHRCDALLYAWRRAFAWSHAPKDLPKRLDEEEKVMAALARMDENALKAERGEWWEAM